jgi:hypothetical protein
MTSIFSSRLLVNIAVVLFVVGANTFIACEQIGVQDSADARTLRSLSLMRDLDAFRSALAGSLPEIGRY